MQVSRTCTAVLLVGLLGFSGCGFSRQVIYRFPVGSEGASLTAYRVPVGVFAYRFELYFEDGHRSALLNAYDGDWYSIKCAAFAFSSKRDELSYIVSITAPFYFEGTYVIGESHPRPLTADGAASLRRSIQRLYSGQEGYPRNNKVDLLDWARDGSGCRGPLAEVFGPQPHE